jgi:hypothetical protein
MSEYQYYEFAALDRPLDRRQQSELRSLSTRADITATGLVNTYQWGDFKGDPRALMEQYFDAHLYLANWGTRRLMLRLPAALVALDVVAQYCVGHTASAWATQDHVVLDLGCEDESDEWDTDGSGLLAAIIGVRSELASADLRLLYLAWLGCVQSEEVDDGDLEPPVPAGLQELSGSLTAVVDFLRLDTDLIAAAAANSPRITASGPSATRLSRWITGLPAADKDIILERLITTDDRHLRSELLRRYQSEQPGAPLTTELRSAGQLVATADQLRVKRDRRAARQQEVERVRRERSAAIARQRHLDALAVDEPAAWRRIATMIDTKKPREYDTAVELLVDLRDLSDRDGHAPRFSRQLADLRSRHAQKPSLLKRLDVAGFGK